MDPMETARAEAAKQAVILAFAIITMLVIMAISNPDAVREWRMRLAAAARRILARAAWRAGHSSMGIELSTGRRSYTLPFLLSKLRDRASRIYDGGKADAG